MENANSSFDSIKFILRSRTDCTFASGAVSESSVVISKTEDLSEYPERYSDYLISVDTIDTTFTANGDYEFDFEVLDTDAEETNQVSLKIGKLIYHVVDAEHFTQPTDTGFKFKVPK